ncbi:DUF4097 family beta strand repeat-containing protein [Fervidibacillus halotolerans]|uniref:DUF4097 family beta strand repeat-containing protein n=1 Tax=Fervidibacillus halotolerans TaxID=2980027 RepID=A0A9E8LY92_9BACI|nr:DUF4097 domain-containing protein [Fervidibacillus halotolerans]WAA11963.1 DUF4097 family beta strand repeat-containing protein [Fervidibacillus halotolerans]
MEERRKQILERVKNGELSVEEAMKLLENLDEGQQKEKCTTMETEFLKKEQFTETEENKFKTATNKLANIFEQAVSKVKEMDLDFYHSVEVSHVFQQNYSQFTNIYIDIPNGDVTVSVWDHTDVRIECQGKVYREDNPEKGKEKFLKEIEFVQSDEILFFKSKDKFMKVNAKIYIPEKMYRKINVKLINGPITCEQLQAEKLDCNTANGKVRLASCSGRKGDLETVNGQVTIIDGDFGELDVETVNGKVNIDGKFKKLDVETIGGTIMTSVKNSDMETARIRSTTGSVYVKLPTEIGIYGELKSHLGNLQVDFPDILVKQLRKDFVSKLFVFEKVSDASEMLKLYAEAKTGSIFIQPL